MAALGVLSLALLVAADVPNQVSTVPTVDPEAEARRKAVQQRPRPSTTAYYPYPYQLNKRPQRPFKFQAANQVYDYPFSFARGLYPTIMRQASDPWFRRVRRTIEGLLYHPHHADLFHAVNQVAGNEPGAGHAATPGVARVPCNRHPKSRRRPRPTCTVWPAGAGGGSG